MKVIQREFHWRPLYPNLVRGESWMGDTSEWHVLYKDGVEVGAEEHDLITGEWNYEFFVPMSTDERGEL